MVTPQQFLQPQVVRPQQMMPQQQAFDISQLINMIIPIMSLMMVFGMLTPMMKGMSEGFGSGSKK